MDPLAYCREKVAPDGSAGYYALVFQPPRQRGTLLALMALERELQDVVEDCSEPAVAMHKLAFWREQLGRLLDGGATHPVCVALARSELPALEAAALERLLLGVARRVDVAQVPDEASLDASCLATAGVVGECMARVVAPDDRRAAASSATAAAAVERVRLLRLPRRAGRPPHAGVPLDLMTGCGATPAQVDRGDTAEPARALRRELLARARARVADAGAGLSCSRGLAATRLRIAASELNALTRSGYVEAATARAPLPVSLLWAAWRTRPRSA